MKLLKCHIENFGKLRQFDFEFQEGLNIINKENGFGKTTFATFIKSMFYGLDAGTNARTENSERKLYMPWQGGVYGGNIEFEIDEKKYKIERFFEKKQSDDIFKLYDLSTNLESFDYTENIGEEIFRINKSGYERSTYIPQGKIKITMEDSLNAKLSNLLESDNDINSSDEAIKKINDSKKNYQKERGKGGLIDEKKEKLFRLERELENSKFDLEALELKKNTFNEKTKKLTKTENIKKEKQELLTKKIEQGRKEAKLETYQTIMSKYNETYKKLNELNDFFENKIPEKFKDNKITKESIQKDIKKNKKTNITLSSLSIFLLILGLIFILSNIQNIVGILIIIASVILLGINFIIIHNKAIKLNSLKAEYNAFNELLELKKEENLTTNEQYKSISQEKEKFEKENNLEELKNIPDISYISEEELNAQILRINAQISNLIDEKNQLKNQIEILENKIDENEYLESDIENLKEEIQTITNKYNILSKTENLLKLAKTNFSSNYLKGMTEGFEKYLNFIDNKNLTTNVDINLDVKIDSNGSQKEIKYFSSGYKDLIYICMRFSLIDALFKNEKPFVIIDDPFVNLDEEKTAKALEILNEFANKYQVIYFVCNSNRI